MFRLDENVAIVTGGSRGIGRAISTMLSRAGAYVVVADIVPADETLKLITDAGGKGETKCFDVSVEDAAQEAIRELAKRLGRIDILVNNAGIALDQLLLRVSAESLHRTFSVNVDGAIYCTKAAIRSMMRAERGRVINLASVVAELGNPGQTAYSASKAAIIGLTKTWAREYAQRNITVNAVAPGFIDTEMTLRLPEEVKTWILNQTPLGRIGKPDDVAAAVVFLCSEEASYITGQVIRVNGGILG
ncbi:MAG: 3-oxoacyl-ACP reductase FabG [Deltaproteobacteria bacterium]|nr:3-oxoacyl-ACP reductase FabG [Deltaproteobacteria bacterium]